MQKSDRAEIGLPRIWNIQKLDHAEIGCVEFGLDHAEIFGFMIEIP